jgi:hypothetical protein
MKKLISWSRWLIYHEQKIISYSRSRKRTPQINWFNVDQSEKSTFRLNQFKKTRSDLNKSCTKLRLHCMITQWMIFKKDIETYNDITFARKSIWLTRAKKRKNKTHTSVKINLKSKTMLIKQSKKNWLWTKKLCRSRNFWTIKSINVINIKISNI